MTITGRDQFVQQLAQGKGWFNPYISPSTTGGTAAGATSGFHNLQLFFNNIGTTYPSTLVGFKMPTAPPQQLMASLMTAALSSNSTRGISFGWLYQIGTQNLAATGDQFTHAAGVTFPVLRTVYGVASQPLTLLPVIYVTTATTTTAPVLTMKTVAGGTGYVDQDGNNTVGTVTMTFPAAATAVQTALIMRMEAGDSGVRDIAAIQTNTAAAAGAATVFGWEPIVSFPMQLAQLYNAHDGLTGVFSPDDINPAVATSGTVTAYFVAAITGTVSAQMVGTITGALAA